jgi:hypothetical protein
VGASFSSVDFTTPDPIIITQVTLFDGSNSALALHPRHLGYDSGTIGTADGVLNIHFFNFAAAPLLLRNVVVQDLPRVMSLNAMVVGGKMEDPYGLPFQPFPGGIRKVELSPAPIGRGQSLAVPVAKLSQRRYIDEVITEKDCYTEDRLKGRDTSRCIPGRSISLFPATTTFITAQVVDPSAKYWDSSKRQYVIGPLTSTLFFQIEGRHPDLNKNGVDDYIDIASGRSKDENHDGVPDEVQGKPIK